MAFGDYAVLTDSFDGPDENPIFTNWTTPLLTGNGNCSVNNNLFAGSGTGVNSAWYDIATPAADFEAYVTITVMPGNTRVLRLYGRVADAGTAGADGYFFQLTQNSGSNNDTSQLFRLDNGSATSIASVANFDWAIGDKFGLECIGSSIKAYRDSGSGWTQILSATDATYSAAGPCGLGTSQTTGRLNDFFMGDVPAAAASKPKTLMTLGVG